MRLQPRLTIEGGISLFSTRKGFVCDNVINYEIVLAGGKVVNANAQENPDLWLALKGGSNNFGIVTRIDFKTVPLGKIWGGQIVYNISLVPQALKAFTDFNAANPYDEYASTIQSVAFDAQFGFVGVNDFEYTKPIENPPAFAGYNNIQPRLFSTLRITDLKNITDEQGSFSPDGFRYAMISSKSSYWLLSHVDVSLLPLLTLTIQTTLHNHNIPKQPLLPHHRLLPLESNSNLPNNQHS